jgi:hypothetical protein
MNNNQLNSLYNNHCKKNYKECLKLLINNIFFVLLALFISSCSSNNCACNDTYAASKAEVEKKFIPLNTVPERPKIPESEVE